MSQPEPLPNEPSKLKKLLSGEDEQESPLEKLKQSVGRKVPPQKPPAQQAAFAPPAAASQPKTRQTPLKLPAIQFSRRKLQLLPAFWTIASVFSFAVNLVLLIVLALILQNFHVLGVTLTKLPDHLLGGLYTNFVKMDQAHIRTVIPVSKEIPVQFTLNVSGSTNVTLSEDVVITGALVTVNTGGLNINRARADIILPQGTVLPIFIQNLVVPVDQKVLAELDVAVDIPLNQTELHEPFVGLRRVVEPFYCLLNPCP
ncbi:MAG: hypothetical protein HXY42_11980 [Chloroflexi bacterium]|nr:hypothetical protein [Chloroflexota bacterium]